MEKFLERFGNLAKEMSISNRWRSACCIVAKKVVQDNLALRTKLVGELLKTVRSIGQQTFSEEAFEVHILYPVSLIFARHYTNVLL